MTAVEEPTPEVEVPKPRKQPQDRLKPAAQNEADGTESTEIEFEGVTYSISTSADKLPVRALRAIENGAAFGFVEYVLGSTEFEAMLRNWRRDHGVEATAEDVEPLANDIAVALGFKHAGE